MTIPAGAVFYTKILVTETDGSMEPGFEAIEGSEEMQPILDATVTEVTEHGGTAYIYECRAVRKVVRGRTRVLKVGK